MTATTEAIAEEPLFPGGAYDALAFAFRFNAQQYAPTPCAKLMRGHIGSGKGLVGVDGAAQAGIIRGLIEPLAPWEKAAIAARFAIERKELFKARDTLITPVMASLPTGIHNRRLVDALVQKYFGRKVKLKHLAAEYGLHVDTMTQRWACTRKTLTEIEHRAFGRAEERLIEAGLC